MLSHQIILHPDIPYTARFTPYERKLGFSWYLCPVTVADEQEWLLVNVEFGYVELVVDNPRDAPDVLEQLNDTPIGGHTFSPAENLEGLLQELADNFRHG